MNELKECSSCGAAIVFATPARLGIRNPIDPVPSDTGNIRLFDDGHYTVIAKAELAAYRTAKVPLHTSHFATCPNAAAHRRKSRAT